MSWSTAYVAHAAEDEKVESLAREKQLNELYAEIGKLSTQLNWLKKKSGLPLE